MKRIIKTDNYEGRDRRNGKVNLKPFLIPTLVAVMALGGYRVVISENTTKIEKNTAELTVVHQDTTVLKTQIPEIKRIIDEIKLSQRITQNDIKEILKGISKLSSID